MMWKPQCPITSEVRRNTSLRSTRRLTSPTCVRLHWALMASLLWQAHSTSSRRSRRWRALSLATTRSPRVAGTSTGSRLTSHSPLPRVIAGSTMPLLGWVTVPFNLPYRVTQPSQVRCFG
ncbi:hypothetical protein J8273_6570 [Carpediemonas membranifera]|uniref:Uncharacterized protein n=1 Tax=Carpediemonas membranifera TaxID=201153 RepID=A0A8J6BVV3_9EUKA|nr:hypothetical protein J8273_6570 [Carpediemonas membranifera]|eukprot:KAG9391791.1 hypothetical protein J8273_6570 [Carpediemonas membranifera]